MAQFDVYANPGNNARTYPYVVDVQHKALVDLATRLVVPLAHREHMDSQQLKRLTPTVTHANETLLLMVPMMAALPASQLGNPIGSLAHLRSEILAAIDFAITGF